MPSHISIALGPARHMPGLGSVGRQVLWLRPFPASLPGLSHIVYGWLPRWHVHT